MLSPLHISLLQVPAQCLTPNRRHGALVTEPTIVSKAENRATKMMTVEMFESDLIDMRDKYQVMTGGADQDHGDTERVDTPQGSGVNIIQKIWRKDGYFEQKINGDGNLVSCS